MIDEYFSGIVYLNEKKFEVYKDNESKAGVFDINEGIDWNIKTPRKKYEKASASFKVLINQGFDQMTPDCICTYPRITDYRK